MEEITKKKIGERINAALANSDKLQKELAAHLGVPDNTISYFVSGKRTPNTEQIIKIAEFLNTSADYLLGITNVSTLTDTDEEKTIRTVCDYTGLSEKAVLILNEENSTKTKFSNVASEFIINERVIMYIMAYEQRILLDTASKMPFKEHLEIIKNSKDIENDEKIKYLEKFTDRNGRRLAYFEADEAFKEFLRNYAHCSEYKELEEFEEKASEALNEVFNEVIRDENYEMVFEVKNDA